MQNIERRSFLGAAIGALPLALVGQSIKTPTASKAALVSRGEDRLGERHVLGVSTTAFKVLTQDTGGGLFIIEHASQRKGGHHVICTIMKMSGSTCSKGSTSPKSALIVSN